MCVCGYFNDTVSGRIEVTEWRLNCVFFTEWTDSALNNSDMNYTFIAFTVSCAVYYILLVRRVKLFSMATEPCVPMYLIHNACTHMFTM
jgi:hypothetical protein